MAEELRPDPTLQPPAEAIHMPEPSYQPFALAIGITLALLGIIMSMALVVIGLVIVVWVLVKWIGDARREMASLPLEHGH